MVFRVHLQVSSFSAKLEGLDKEMLAESGGKATTSRRLCCEYVVQTHEVGFQRELTASDEFFVLAHFECVERYWRRSKPLRVGLALGQG